MFSRWMCFKLVKLFKKKKKEKEKHSLKINFIFLNILAFTLIFYFYSYLRTNRIGHVNLRKRANLQFSVTIIWLLGALVHKIWVSKFRSLFNIK